MVDERLRLWMMIGDAEGLNEELLDDLPVGLGGEGEVEGEQGPRGAQTVSGHLQLGHCVDVFNLVERKYNISTNNYRLFMNLMGLLMGFRMLVCEICTNTKWK